MKITIGKFLLFTLSVINFAAYAQWECNVSDKKGHMWSSPGMTQERANAVALSFCTAYSPNGSCHVTNCFEKSDA